MPWKEHQFIIFVSYLLGVFAAFSLPGCSYDADEYARDGNVIYANTRKGVQYVGSQRCAACHTSIYETYSASEMGRSMSILDSSTIMEGYPQKSAVYDPVLDFSYEMVRHGDKFYQREFRRDKAGTITHERRVRADYIIGSGNNLRMYFKNENGMLYELPLTWYVHRKQWDLSPGYRDFGNLRFSRYAGAKCIACHNSYLTLSSTAEDRFLEPFPLGIGCERCHGPGELHIRQKIGEEIPDLPRDAQTIVNPRKLSPQRQLDVCRQCHLQSKATVLRGEKGEFDFRPGMLLESHKSIYSEASTRKEVFEVADSPRRLQLSRCFIESKGAMTCITCHDPHRSIHTFTTEHYAAKCMTCHAPANLPGVSARHHHTPKDNCISCHMKKTGTDNTLHGVSNTDHWIRIEADRTRIDWSTLRRPPHQKPLVRLVPDVDTEDNGSLLRLGIAYVHYYRDHDNRSSFLDSAVLYLSKGLQDEDNNARGLFYLGEVHLEAGRYGDAISFLKQAVALRPSYAEAFYELGEAYLVQKELDIATGSYREAARLMPDEPRYLEGLGRALSLGNNTGDAANVLTRAVTIDSHNPLTFSNLGTLYATRLGKPDSALRSFKEVITLDPDFPDAYLNLGNSYTLLGDYANAIASYERQLQSHRLRAATFVNLGRVYALMGRPLDARKAIRHALQIDPSIVLPDGFLDPKKN